MWENTLTIGSSYKLIAVSVRCFDGVNDLSVGSQSQIVSASDIGDVGEIEEGDIDRLVTSRIVEGEIIAARCVKYTACSTCKVKIDSTVGIQGNCSKCGLTMKVSKCSSLFTADTVESPTSKINFSPDVLPLRYALCGFVGIFVLRFSSTVSF